MEEKRGPLNTRDLAKIIARIEKENDIFANKAYLDILTIPVKIIGRQNQAEELVRYLLGYKQGYVVPFISVYGRSGSGKSTIVRFVCEHLKEISHCFVNLRKAKTVFGASNLILAELDQPNLKNAQGINLAIERIGSSLESLLQKENKKLFVIVLDESDVLFYDKRGSPSDFIYKLIVLEENLRTKGYLLCIVSVSNNLFTDYEIDDRVRSRIGSSEIFFEPYSTSDVQSILKERANEAFSKKISDEVLDLCALLSSQEHGDARRAIDLLRVAAELASAQGETISKVHVLLASDKIQKDRVTGFLSTASYQLKLVCTALARMTYLTGKEWHSTSSIYNQYNKIIQDNVRHLTYRRVSELLMELENTGFAVSETSSKGRHGFGTQHKLTVEPETIGVNCFPDFWKSIVEKKTEHDDKIELRKYQLRSDLPGWKYLNKKTEIMAENLWKDFVG